MTNSKIHPAPKRINASEFPVHLYELHTGVRKALAALPIYFKFDNPILGIDATDLHNINTLMGAAIENQVVTVLNSLRTIWDENNIWTDYSFHRSSQAFPDVRLIRRNVDGTVETAFGIELKGWWLLSKEGEPSLRYQVAPDACAPWDLVCVVPWFLDNAVSGTPSVAEPWVDQARYAAEWRDFWWTNLRKTQDSDKEKRIKYPEGATPYPFKADLVSARPVKDGGNNFGRLPRAKPLMDSFIKKSLEMPILGIPASHWQQFLHIHSENADPHEILRRIIRIVEAPPEIHDEKVESLLHQLRSIAKDYGFDSD